MDFEIVELKPRSFNEHNGVKSSVTSKSKRIKPVSNPVGKPVSKPMTHIKIPKEFIEEKSQFDMESKDEKVESLPPIDEILPPPKTVESQQSKQSKRSNPVGNPTGTMDVDTHTEVREGDHPSDDPIVQDESTGNILAGLTLVGLLVSFFTR
jgi:hypothetical protein